MVDQDQEQLADVAELVLSVARRLGLAARETDTVTLTPLEAMVMRWIDAHPGSTPSQVAAHLGLRSSNASQALRDLEARGFIRRSTDPADARSVRIDPLPAARENLQDKRRSWAAIVGSALSEAASEKVLSKTDLSTIDMPDVDVSEVVEVLRRLDEGLEHRMARP